MVGRWIQYLPQTPKYPPRAPLLLDWKVNISNYCVVLYLVSPNTTLSVTNSQPPFGLAAVIRSPNPTDLHFPIGIAVPHPARHPLRPPHSTYRGRFRWAGLSPSARLYSDSAAQQMVHIVSRSLTVRLPSPSCLGSVMGVVSFFFF